MGNMDDNQMTSNTNNSAPSSGEDSPTRPRKRLQRILSSELETSLDKSVLPPTEGQPPALLPDTPPIHIIDNQSVAVQTAEALLAGGEPVAPSEPPLLAPEEPASSISEAQTVPILVELPPSVPPFTQLPATESDAPTLPPPGGTLKPVISPPPEQYDINATQVTPAAYIPSAPPPQPAPKPTIHPPIPPRPTQTISRPAVPPPQPPRKAAATNGKRRSGWGCMVRSLIIFLFLVVLAFVLTASYAVIQYSIIASTFKVDELRAKAAQFETTTILDRNGNVLYEIIDPNAGRRTYVPLSKISPYLVAATLATEDKDFYINPGFDPIAILRALWQNYTLGEVYSGASTITQQLARMLLLPNERYTDTVERKSREIVLAAEITRKFSKDEILELYLNEIFYGSMAYGVEAAAQTYFGVTASQLSLGQSAFLAGIGQAPAIYDIFTNRELTLDRFQTVIVLTNTLSKERSCITTSNAVKPVCVDDVAAAKALEEIEKYPFKQSVFSISSPHWVTYIRSQLEAQFDPQTIYRSGFKVYTTLDPALQSQAEKLVKSQVQALTAQKVTGGALVAIRPSTGEILSMVGSPDFYGGKSGQINMATSPRQPGSAIKPLTYVAAFEKGWTPATLIWDVSSEFPPSGDPTDTRAPYKPTNYDLKEHGPLSVRVALANSFNIPAVKALEYVGIYDNPNIAGPDGLIAFAKRLGINSFTRQDYGLALTLGGGEVSLLELTSAYTAFANGGRRFPTYAISKIEDHNGKVVYEHKSPPGEQVIRSEHAYLISSILSDNDARSWMFGANSVLKLPFPAAVKTGTTTDMRDNLAIGYNPDIVTGVWVGNPDNTPMVNTTGLSGAAPIWSQFMQVAVQSLTGGKPTPFTRPAGVVERVVCAASGTEPSGHCPSQRSEFFAYDQLPPSKDQDLWVDIEIDTWTGLRASAACSEYTEDKLVLNVTDKWALRWIKDSDAGRAWAEKMGFKAPVTFMPARECKIDDPRPLIVFSGLTEGQVITSPPLDIYAVVDVSKGFKEFQLRYGLGDNPAEWKKLGNTFTRVIKQPELLTSWDMKNLPTGKFTLNIRLDGTSGYAKKSIHLVNQVPTATPTPTITLTATPTVTSTSTVTLTPTITFTPTLTFTPEPVSPTPTPTATSTPTPTLTPTPPPPPSG